MDDSDLQVLRQRSSDRIIRTDRLVLPDPVTTPRMLVRTVSGGSYPTADGRYYLCNPVSISGSESENGTVTLAADTSITIPVLLIRGVPPVGTNLVARSIGGRWLAEYKASGGGTVSLCTCTVPTTVTCTYSRYDISGTLIGGPATVAMSYVSEVAFPSCTSRGPGFRSVAPLDPAVYPDIPTFGNHSYITFRCAIFTIELRIIQDSGGSFPCFYGANFASISICSPFFVQGVDASPGLANYTRYTITP